MSKKILKGGQESEQNPMQLFLGIVIIILIISIIVIVIYMLIRDSCSDQGRALCSNNQSLKTNEYCDLSGCDRATCCEEIKCMPPENRFTLPKGYKNTSQSGDTRNIIKFSEFDAEGTLNASGRPGFDTLKCDKNYTGVPKLQRCDNENKYWGYTGCSTTTKKCSDGVSTSKTAGTTPRIRTTCDSILSTEWLSLAFWNDNLSFETTKEKKCDSHYQENGNSQTDGNFCKLETAGTNHDKCVAVEACIPP